MSKQFKVESGIQLLARLLKKPGIENFYPILFENGPKQGDVVEIFSDANVSNLLFDIICQSLLPVELGGVEAGILIFSTDGNLDIGILLETFKSKFIKCLRESSTYCNLNLSNIDTLFAASLQKLFLVELFDATEFYVTLQNLENTLHKNCNISFVIFDTLTAFYWSEQCYKICKMELYIKTLLKTIRKITKDYKTTVLYTRPGYFHSSKEIERLTPEEINYRIEITHISNATFEVEVRTNEKQVKQHFNVCDGYIQWH